MNEPPIHKALETYDGIDHLSMEDLETLVETHPYFQTAHLMRAKKASLLNQKHLPAIIARTATQVVDRQMLFKYLHFNKVQAIDNIEKWMSQERDQLETQQVITTSQEWLSEEEADIRAEMADLREEIYEEFQTPEEEEDAQTSKVVVEEPVLQEQTLMEKEKMDFPDTGDLKPRYEKLMADREALQLAHQEQDNEQDHDLHLEEEAEDLVEANFLKKIQEIDALDTDEIKLDTGVITAEAVLSVQQELEQQKKATEDLKKKIKQQTPKKKTPKLVQLKQSSESYDDAIRRDVEKDLERLKQEKEDFGTYPDAQKSIEGDDDLLQMLKDKVDTYKKSKHNFDSWLEIERNPPTSASGSVMDEDTGSDSGAVNHPFSIATMSDEDELAIKDYVSKHVSEDLDQFDDIAEEEEEKDVLSETMAKVYARQGHFDKAINIYQQLMLKYPEKRPYFAVTIEELKKQLL